MRWSDDGIFLTGRPHGETSAITDIFTREHGRSLGLVKGGRSRRIRPALQTGNILKVEWRARLDEQLGVFTVELVEPIAAHALENELALTGVMSVTALLRELPERDPHARLFEAVLGCLRAVGSTEFTAAIVRFELRFLDELGFGLDLSKCAATGRKDDLVFVSPKSGQAVSREAGEAFRNKLLPLPPFLAQNATAETPPARDLADGLAMTGHFLSVHIFGESGRAMPHAREQLARLLRRSPHA